MALAPLSTWNSTFNAQVLATMGDFVSPFKGWLNSMASPLSLSGMPAASFIFNQAAFGAAISSASPVMDKATALKIFADGWASAVSASTMIIPGGVSSVTNASSAKNVVFNVLFNADITKQSAFPEAFRSGFLALKYTVTIFGLPPVTYPSGTI